nr:immunoglobulin heavy chain junction region [Macaca mulatta]
CARDLWGDHRLNW